VISYQVFYLSQLVLRDKQPLLIQVDALGHARKNLDDALTLFHITPHYGLLQIQQRATSSADVATVLLGKLMDNHLESMCGLNEDLELELRQNRGWQRAHSRHHCF